MIKYNHLFLLIPCKLSQFSKIYYIMIAIENWGHCNYFRNNLSIDIFDT